MKFEIKSRWSDSVMFECDLDADDMAPLSARIGMAVKIAIKANADLRGADLRDANLGGADLRYADLRGANGLNDWIKCIQIDAWPITYTSDVMQIGCQRHSIEAWRNFSDAEIRAMDGLRALNFWRKWKSWIFQTMEMAPARPTKDRESEAAQ